MLCDSKQFAAHYSGVRGCRIKAVNSAFIERRPALNAALELFEGTSKCKGTYDINGRCIWENSSGYPLIIS